MQVLGIKESSKAKPGVKQPVAVDDTAAAIDAFHDAVFSPRIELTQSDISSLDGRAVRGHAKGIIDTIKGIDGVPKRKVKP